MKEAKYRLVEEAKELADRKDYREATGKKNPRPKVSTDSRRTKPPTVENQKEALRKADETKESLIEHVELAPSPSDSSVDITTNQSYTGEELLSTSLWVEVVPINGLDNVCGSSSRDEVSSPYYSDTDTEMSSLPPWRDKKKEHPWTPTLRGTSKGHSKTPPWLSLIHI